MGSAVPPDPYRLLGLGPEATAADVRRAFRRLAMLAHPDAGGDPIRFVALRRAHDLLCDPAARAALDAELGAAAAAPHGSHPYASSVDATSTGGSTARGRQPDQECRDAAARLREVWPSLGVVWRLDGVSATPIEVDSAVVVAAGPGGAVGPGGPIPGPAVVAVDARRGTERWRAGLAAPVVAAPVVAEDLVTAGHLVVVATVDGVVHGLDLRTGATRWERRLDAEPLAVVSHGSIAVVRSAYALTAVRADGVVAWAVRPHGGTVAVVPAGPVLAMRTGADAVVGVDPRTGGTRWWLRGAAPWEYLPVVAGASLWLPEHAPAGEVAGRLVGVDPRTGAAAQALRCPATVLSVHEVGGLLVVRDVEGGLTAVRNGRPQWRMVMPTQSSVPVAVGDDVAVATAEGVLRFLSGRHGTELHQVGMAPSAGGPASLLVEDGGVVVTGVDGGLVAHRVVTRAGEPSPR